MPEPQIEVDIDESLEVVEVPSVLEIDEEPTLGAIFGGRVVVEVDGDGSPIIEPNFDETALVPFSPMHPENVRADEISPQEQDWEVWSPAVLRPIGGRGMLAPQGETVEDQIPDIEFEDMPTETDSLPEADGVRQTARKEILPAGEEVASTEGGETKVEKQPVSEEGPEAEVNLAKRVRERLGWLFSPSVDFFDFGEQTESVPSYHLTQRELEGLAASYSSATRTEAVREVPATDIEMLKGIDLSEYLEPALYAAFRLALRSGSVTKDLLAKVLEKVRSRREAAGGIGFPSPSSEEDASKQEAGPLEELVTKKEETAIVPLPTRDVLDPSIPDVEVIEPEDWHIVEQERGLLTEGLYPQIPAETGEQPIEAEFEVIEI